MRYVNDRELAKDLVHDSFITAIDKYETYSGRGPFDAWLRKIVVNKLLLHIRNNRKLDFVQIDDSISEEPLAMGFDAGYTTTMQLVANKGFSHDDLITVLAKLPEQYRSVFNLYVLEEYTHSEIASFLNIKVGTSKSTLARARKKIAEMLFERVDDTGRKTDQQASAAIIAMIYTGFIDAFFKKVFANALDSTGTMSVPLENRIAQLSFTKNKIAAVQANVILASVVGFAALFSALLVAVKQSRKYIATPVMDSITMPSTTQVPSPGSIDSIPVIWHQQARTSSPNSNMNDSIQNKRVIVRKQIIIHDTIFIDKNMQ